MKKFNVITKFPDEPEKNSNIVVDEKQIESSFDKHIQHIIFDKNFFSMRITTLEPSEVNITII